MNGINTNFYQYSIPKYNINSNQCPPPPAPQKSTINSEKPSNNDVKIAGAVILTALAAYGLYKGRNYLKSAGQKLKNKPSNINGEKPAANPPAEPKINSAAPEKSGNPVQKPAQKPDENVLEPVKQTPEPAPAKSPEPRTTTASETPKTEEIQQTIKNSEAKPEPVVNKNVEINRNISAAEEDMFFETVNQYNPSIRSAHYAEANGRAIKPEYKKDIEDTMKELDALFEKSTPLAHEQVVYRGLGTSFCPGFKNFEKILKDAKIGDVIVPDSGYQYVSWNKTLANQYAGNMFLEIHLPKGTKMIHHGQEFIPEALGESVLARNARFKVLQKETEANGRLNYVLELVQ